MHYFVADEIAKHPDSEQKFVVIVRDKENKSADVVLPAGASLEVNNEVSGMSKQRIEHALQKEGFLSVKFYNPNGALGYHPDDGYFAGKDIFFKDEYSIFSSRSALRIMSKALFTSLSMASIRHGFSFSSRFQ